MLEKFCLSKGIKLKKDYDFGSLHGYKTKGVVKYYLEISSKTDIIDLLKLAREQNFKMVACGEGSNILIKDYFDGLFVKWIDEKIDVSNKKKFILLKVSAGVKKSYLSDYCIQNSLSGLEFWAGIPGLVGGGTAMNAGAYCMQGQDCIVQVQIATPDGLIKKIGEDLKWDYRKIKLPEYSVIISTMFALEKDKEDQIRKRCDEYIKDREGKHPLEFPSCGSVFKNPSAKETDKGAWWLIREAGLSGFSIGGAKVSEKHTNFIINTGGATSSDVLNLIAEIKKRVKAKFNIQLEEEIRIF
ncbi:MAG: UDP-N-acetylmuramate dehydrogenase [Proteobacteria bacterium]|nr:UDP-N-acetylmuramate dehydrogenase [Pseudomonadota bacterium]